MFSGRPTEIWSAPLVSANSADFGVRADGFGFLISWAPNAPVVVEASTDLAHSEWLPLSTHTPPSGTFRFSDPDWTAHS